MTSAYNRRTFLQQAAVTASVLAVPACSQPASPTPPPATSSPNEKTTPATPATSSPAPMIIAQWKGAEPTTPESLQKVVISVTEKAIEGIGGLGAYIPKGSTVWIKPNINFHRTPEFAANTNPDVVRYCHQKVF